MGSPKMMHYNIALPLFMYATTAANAEETNTFCRPFAEEAAKHVATMNNHGPQRKGTAVSGEETATFKVFFTVSEDGEPDKTATYAVTTRGAHSCLILKVELDSIK